MSDRADLIRRLLDQSAEIETLVGVDQNCALLREAADALSEQPSTPPREPTAWAVRGNGFFEMYKYRDLAERDQGRIPGTEVVPLYDDTAGATPPRDEQDARRLDWLERSNTRAMFRSGKQTWRGLIDTAMATDKQPNAPQ